MLSCSLPGELNSIQMMNGGKLLANQTVRILLARRFVSVDENVRTLHLGRRSNERKRPRKWRERYWRKTCMLKNKEERVGEGLRDRERRRLRK